MNKFRYFMDWHRVRKFGELKVLTRASYGILILVPILAGLWPGVRIVLNNYNQAVVDSRAALDETSSRLQILTQRLEILISDNNSKGNVFNLAEHAQQTLNGVETRIEELLANYSIKTVESDTLPSIWCWAFLASLIVFFTHMLYQIWGPDPIRQNSLEQWVLNKKNQFSENSSNNYLELAEHCIKRTEGTDVFKAKFLPKPTSKPDVRRWEFDLVEHGAKAEYYEIARDSLGKSWLVGLLYVFAILIVLYIVKLQTELVFNAAGWIP